MKRRKKILLNWWYDRKDLLAPFLQLQEEIEFVLLFHKKPSGAEQFVPFRCIFWDNFSSPYKILEEIAPEKVVFINIDGFYQISLNIACQLKNIPTEICDHGLAGYADYPVKKINFAENKLKSLAFLFASIKLKNSWLLPDLARLVYHRLQGANLGSTGTKLRALGKPNRFICYTGYAADFIVSKDGVNTGDITVIGNPTFDDFFTPEYSSARTIKDNYYLLIDQPFVQSTFNTDLISLEQKNDFLFKLATFCGGNETKLVVKLHPQDFGQNYFLQHPTILYIEEANLPGLIQHSNGVFGFYSTLLIPAIVLKECVLFRVQELAIQTLWHKLGVVKLLDFFSFNVADIDFESACFEDGSFAEFERIFIFKADGLATQRLKKALLA